MFDKRDDCAASARDEHIVLLFRSLFYIEAKS